MINIVVVILNKKNNKTKYLNNTLITNKGIIVVREIRHRGE